MHLDVQITEIMTYHYNLDAMVSIHFIYNSIYTSHVHERRVVEYSGMICGTLCYGHLDHYTAVYMTVTVEFCCSCMYLCVRVRLLICYKCMIQPSKFILHYVY